MNKKSVVIASVLKTVTDSRNYEKLAISISLTGNYQVILVGQPVRDCPIHDSIAFNPIFSFERLSFKRLFAPLVFFKFLMQTKPDWVMVTTFELLFPAMMYKLFFGKVLTYDVQENYFRNTWFGNSFPFGLKQVLALKIRAIEIISKPFVNHYYLAEQNYASEFSFHKGKSSVLENKLRKTQVLPKNRSSDGTLQFIYTGTIAENYGIYEAVSFIKKMHQLDPTVRLKIIGFAAQREVFDKLNKSIEGFDFIELVGGNSYVPHTEILQAIANSDFGLVPYRSNKSTENCIPTKMYEYLVFHLPFIYSKNVLWKSIADKYDAGIEMDFTIPDVTAVYADLKNRKYYTKKISEKDLFWQEPDWKY